MNEIPFSTEAPDFNTLIESTTANFLSPPRQPEKDIYGVFEAAEDTIVQALEEGTDLFDLLRTCTTNTTLKTKDSRALTDVKYFEDWQKQITAMVQDMLVHDTTISLGQELVKERESARAGNTKLS